MWFFETTGDPLALDLANAFGKYHLEHSTCLGGGICAPPPKHTHSYFSTLRGLLLLGELAGQRIYIQRVAETYETTVRRAVKESGFISHD